MSEKLKPCPECGGFPMLWEEVDFNNHGVVCHSCNYELDAFSSEKEAIEAWNTRVEK